MAGWSRWSLAAARSTASRLACAPTAKRKARCNVCVEPFSKRHGVHSLTTDAASAASTGINDEIRGDSDSGHGKTSRAGDHVNVARSRSSDDASARIQPHAGDDATDLVDRLLRRTSDLMDPHAVNVVAYSGGVDSSLVAALVHRAFADHQTTSSSSRGSVQAVLGVSPAVPQSQIVLAREVAETIGIPLTEVATAESKDDAYRRNDGYACYVCKTHLYSTLDAVAKHVEGQRCHHDDQQPVVLYNGTNADDREDPTRLGLLAASEFRVRSPLDRIAKEQVRRAARHLGLPNWDAAASPCLRSRLARGVRATAAHLRAVERAEAFVRNALDLDGTVDARVRMLAGGRAMVELDRGVLGAGAGGGADDGGGENWATELLRERGFEERLGSWGFNSFGGVRGFKTGSVAAVPTENSRPVVSVVS